MTKSKWIDWDAEPEVSSEPWEPWEPKVGDKVRFRIGERPDLECPECKAKLIEAFGNGKTGYIDQIYRFQNQWLVCSDCGVKFPMRDQDRPFNYAMMFDEPENEYLGVMAAAIELELL